MNSGSQKTWWEILSPSLSWASLFLFAKTIKYQTTFVNETNIFWGLGQNP